MRTNRIGSSFLFVNIYGKSSMNGMQNIFLMEIMGEHRFDFIAPYFCYLFLSTHSNVLNASPLGLSFLNAQSAEFGSARIEDLSKIPTSSSFLI